MQLSSSITAKQTQSLIFQVYPILVTFLISCIYPHGQASVTIKLYKRFQKVPWLIFELKTAAIISFPCIEVVLQWVGNPQIWTHILTLLELSSSSLVPHSHSFNTNQAFLKIHSPPFFACCMSVLLWKKDWNNQVSSPPLWTLEDSPYVSNAASRAILLIFFLVMIGPAYYKLFSQMLIQLLPHLYLQSSRSWFLLISFLVVALLLLSPSSHIHWFSLPLVCLETNSTLAYLR